MPRKGTLPLGRKGLKLGRSGALLAGAAALTFALTWISLTAFPAVPRQNDSVDYYSLANYLAGIGGSPSLFVPPGYPLFINLIRYLDGPHYGGLLMFLQHVLRLAPFAVFLVLARFLPNSLAPGLAALIWVLSPESYVFSHYVMSESLAIGLTSSAVLSLLWLWRRPGLPAAATAGLLTAVLTLVRPAGPVILAAALFGLWVGRSRTTVRPRLEAGAVAVAVWFAGILPWLVHNYMLEGTFSVVNSTGRHLFNRVVVEQGLLKKDDPGMAALEKVRADPKSAGPTYWWHYHSKLMRNGMSETESDELMKGVAFRGIAGNPAAYAAWTLTGAVSMAWWTPLPPGGSTFCRVVEYDLNLPMSTKRSYIVRNCNIIPTLDAKRLLDDLEIPENPPGLIDNGQSKFMSAWLEAWAYLGLGLHVPLILLFMLGLLSMFLPRSRILKFDGRDASTWAPPLAAVVLLWLLGHAAAEIPVPRYALPVQPLVILAVVLGAKALWSLRSAAVRRRKR